MADPSTQTVTERQTQAQPQKKGGCGKCCLVGCLGMLVLIVGVSVGGYFYVSRLVNAYVTAEPVELPEVKTTPGEVAAIKLRMENFARTVESPAARGTLVLTADDLNKLIVSDPESAQWRDRIRIHIENGTIGGKISVPFDDMATTAEDREAFEKIGLAGRYFNADARFKISLVSGVLVVKLDKVSAAGVSLPSLIMNALRKKNLAEDFARQNPDAAKALSKIESIKVEGDKIIIRSKGGGVPVPAPPAEAGPPPFVPEK